MRLCKDCKHYRFEVTGVSGAQGNVQIGYDVCDRVSHFDVVHGPSAGGDPRLFRAMGECGPEGKLFEAKP
jgi:hypothetical protein